MQLACWCRQHQKAVCHRALTYSVFTDEGGYSHQLPRKFSCRHLPLGSCFRRSSEAFNLRPLLFVSRDGERKQRALRSLRSATLPMEMIC